jgi:hypothetical protein
LGVVSATAHELAADCRTGSCGCATPRRSGMAPSADTSM